MAELTSSEVLAKVKADSYFFGGQWESFETTTIESEGDIGDINFTLVLSPTGQGSDRYLLSGSIILYWGKGTISEIISSELDTDYSGIAITKLEVTEGHIYCIVTGPEVTSDQSSIEIEISIKCKYFPWNLQSKIRPIISFYQYNCENIMFYSEEFGIMKPDWLSPIPLTETNDYILYTEDRQYFITVQINWKQGSWKFLLNNDFDYGYGILSKNEKFLTNPLEGLIKLTRYYPM